MDGGNFGRIGGPAFIAGATIAPFVMVKLGSTVRQVLTAAAVTDQPIGISQPAMLGTPGVAGSSTVIAATVGLPIDVITVGNVAKLTLGVGGATAGNPITSDANGNGVVGVAGNYIIGYALETGIAGDLIDVWVMPQKF